MGASINYIPVFSISGCLLIAVLVIITEHRQRMLMIKKGYSPDNNFSSSGLRSGLIFSLVSLVVLVVTKDLGTILSLPWYAPGCILLAMGLANLLYYILKGRYEHKSYIFGTGNRQLKIEN